MATMREILAGRAAVEISVRDKLKAGLAAAQARLQNFATNVAALGISFSSLSSLASRAMGLISSTFTGPADQLQNMADRTGLSVETLQALAEAGADSGATLEDVGGASRALANFLQSVEHGSDAAKTSLAELGVEGSSLGNMSQDQRLATFADALSRISDPARRAALAQDVFGRGAMNLLPILGQGSKAIAAYRQRLAEVGALRTAEQVAAADELGDAMARLQRRVQALGFSALVAMAPTLQRIADAAVGVVEAMNQWVVANGELAQWIGVAIVAVAAGAVMVAVLTSAVLAMSAVVTAATTVWGVLSAAISAAVAVIGLIATPMGAIVALAVALAGVLATLAVMWARNTEAGQQMVTNLVNGLSYLWQRAVQVFRGIADALAAGNLQLAGQVAMAGLNLAFVAGWGGLKVGAATAMEFVAKVIVGAITWAVKIATAQLELLFDGYNKLAAAIGRDPIETPWDKAESFGVAINSLLESQAKTARMQMTRDLAAAGKELDKLTAEAAKAKEERAALFKASGKPSGEPPKQQSQKDIAKATAERAAGTFSASLAGSLAQSTRAERLWGDMVDLQKQVVNALQNIEQKFDQGKLVVAE